MLRFDLTALACAAATAAASGQVPVGSTLISVISNIPPSQGLFLADRTGACVPVTGLAATSFGINVNAVALDPIDDRVWLASRVNGQVSWLRIAGTTVTQVTPHVTCPVSVLNAIVFDDNANPIVCGGTGIFRVSRRNAGTATQIATVPAGEANALAKDAAGNLYVGLWNAGGAVLVMTKNADGSFQQPVPFATVAVPQIMGLTFAPAAGVNADELWVATFAPAGSALYRVPVPLGGVGMPVVNTVPGPNWVEYDRARDDLLVLPNVTPHRLERLDRSTGANTTVCAIQGGAVGTPSASDTHDAPFAAVQVAPRILNGSVGPFHLEIGTTAPPGTLAIVGVASPTVIVAAAGIVGANGRLWASYPNVTLTGPLAPGSLQFLAAYFDLQGNLVVGAPVAWPTL